MPLGKLHIWEVATWEVVTGEVALGKMPLGKYLTPTQLGNKEVLKNLSLKMVTLLKTQSSVDLYSRKKNKKHDWIQIEETEHI